MMNGTETSEKERTGNTMESINVPLGQEGCNQNESQNQSSQSTTTTDNLDCLLERLAAKIQIPCLKYELSVLEQLRYEAFAEKHKDCMGPLSISFCSTGIGNVVKLHCGGCGDVRDITDVSQW